MKKVVYFPYANMVTYNCYVKQMWNPRYNIYFKLSKTHIGSNTLIRLYNKNVLPATEIGHPVVPPILPIPNGNQNDPRFTALESLIVSHSTLLLEQIGNSYSLLRDVQHQLRVLTGQLSQLHVHQTPSFVGQPGHTGLEEVISQPREVAAHHYHSLGQRAAHYRNLESLMTLT